MILLFICQIGGLIALGDVLKAGKSPAKANFPRETLSTHMSQEGKSLKSNPEDKQLV